MIIDVHLHLSLPQDEHPWVLDWMRGNYDGDFDSMVERVLTPQGLRDYLQQNHVDWGVGMAEITPITTGWTTNEFVGELCAAANALPDPPNGARGRLLPFASINPYISNDLAAELDELVRKYKFRGIKVYPVYHHHYVNEPRMYPLYAKAQALGLPVLVHTGSSIFKGARIKYGDPLALDDVAIDFPELTIMMAHSGRPFWYEQAFWMARRHDNVYMELSGLPGKNLLNYFPRLEMIHHKVVYGSDWPGNSDLQRNVAAIKNLSLSAEAKQAILYDNAARIFRIGEYESK